MATYPRIYTTIAFVAGVLLTLGFKDFYPDLERRFRRRRGYVTVSEAAVSGTDHTVQLDKHLEYQKQPSFESLPEGREEILIGEGIEACIGNTPIFRIKSLSEATGCEILAKAEVCRKQYGVVYSSNPYSF